MAAHAAVLLTVIALGGVGGAEAAGLLTSKNVKDDSLLSRDFRNGSIEDAKVADGQLSPADLAFSVRGDQGDQGLPGLPGRPGLRGITIREGPVVEYKDVPVVAGANCAAGEVVLSGGAVHETFGGADVPYFLSSSRFGGQRWETSIDHPADSIEGADYRPWVICATIG